MQLKKSKKLRTTQISVSLQLTGFFLQNLWMNLPKYTRIGPLQVQVWHINSSNQSNGNHLLILFKIVSVPAFSAVCWFYGRDMYDQYKVPMGMVSSNWGGTPDEAWSSPDALEQCTSASAGSKTRYMYVFLRNLT